MVVILELGDHNDVSQREEQHPVAPKTRARAHSRARTHEHARARARTHARAHARAHTHTHVRTQDTRNPPHQPWHPTHPQATSRCDTPGWTETRGIPMMRVRLTVLRRLKVCGDGLALIRP
jgi:hypothetical protein